jgi:L-ascorbate metabolism protein UlaG (beta-lactamase superfamily)
MATQITWLGHACWLVETGDHRILLDPFLNDSPTAPKKADQVEADFILISHGHFDHIADAATIAKRCQSTVICPFEIAEWLGKNHGVSQSIGMNLGGTTEVPFGRVRMTMAFHSSQLPDGSYGGHPSGFVLHLAEGAIYFACDTCLFSDMKLIGELGIDLAVLPIGDLFTMGPEESIRAIEWIQPRRVAPTHYNTWPPIEQDANAWATLVRERTQAEPIVLQPGESFSL